MAAVLSASLWFMLSVGCFMVASADQRNITAKPGGNIILPCRAAENKPVLLAEWSRTDLGSGEFVVFYRHEMFDPEYQSEAFRNRVDLQDPNNGDVSLILNNVMTNDTGIYKCRVLQITNYQQRSYLNSDPISIVNLRVVSDQTNITAKPGENVTLPCRAAENKPVLTAEWNRTDLRPGEYVILYTDGKFDPNGQSEAFKNRVDLQDPKNGDMSLILNNVITNDTGIYECRVEQITNYQQRSYLNSDPFSIVNLRVVSGNKDGSQKEGRSGLMIGVIVGVFIGVIV